MKITSDLIWAIILLGLATASFFLGMKRASLSTDQQLEDKITEIRILKNKNEQLAEELRSRGIYSYPQANVVFEKGDPEAKILIMLNGKDPIPGLEIKRKAITDHSGNENNVLELIRDSGKTTQIGTLSAHNPVIFDVDNFKNEMAMDLTFKSERNLWHQFLRARKTSQGEIKTFWIITNKEFEVIDKHIDKGFPTDDDGNVTLGTKEKMKYSEIRMNSVFYPYSREKSETN